MRMAWLGLTLWLPITAAIAAPVKTKYLKVVPTKTTARNPYYITVKAKLAPAPATVGKDHELWVTCELNPKYKVAWNNLTQMVVKVRGTDGVKPTKTTIKPAQPKKEHDTGKRVFKAPFRLTAAPTKKSVVDLDLTYFVCDLGGNWCKKVQQTYSVSLAP